MRLRPVTAALAGVLLVLGLGTPVVADDQVREMQWHLDYLNVEQAHRITRGEGVIVAVIDTGVDAGHPDLSGSVLPGMDFMSGGGNGWTDPDGHGTAMAGLIAAHGRALGIAPEAKILPIRVEGDILFSTGAAQDADAIQWATDRGADVICLAASKPLRDGPLEDAVQRAIDADVVVVAAAGNRPRRSQVGYPAAYPGVVAAAGVDQHGNHAEVSVTGHQVVLAAPAVDIISTGSRQAGDTGYLTGTGTSNATAIIAGAAALVRAKYPDLSAAEVVHRLTATADDRGRPGRDDEYGYGVIDLVAALTADVPPLTPSATPTTPTSTPAPSSAAPPPGKPGPTLLPYLAGAAALAVLVFLLATRRRTTAPK